MHWQVAWLPKVTKKDVNGKPPAYWYARANQSLLDPAVVSYSVTENWHDDDLLSRGGYPAFIRTKRFLLIGAGALGSLVAEYLVRGGVRNLVVMDGDNLAAANLSRHALNMSDVGQQKASRLARYLNSLSPQVEAVGIDKEFSASSITDAALRCEVVLECTAENNVLVEMSRTAWPRNTTFVSLSVGWAARTLISVDLTANDFPADVVINQLQSVMAYELAARGTDPTPREGLGCWSMVFPARHDGIALAAAGAVQYVLEAISSPVSEPRLRFVEPTWRAKDTGHAPISLTKVDA